MSWCPQKTMSRCSQAPDLLSAPPLECSTYPRERGYLQFLQEKSKDTRQGMATPDKSQAPVHSHRPRRVDGSHATRHRPRSKLCWAKVRAVPVATMKSARGSSYLAALHRERVSLPPAQAL